MGKVHLEGSGCFGEETGRFCGYSSKENRQPAESFWAGQAHCRIMAHSKEMPSGFIGHIWSQVHPCLPLPSVAVHP